MSEIYMSGYGEIYAEVFIAYDNLNSDTVKHILRQIEEQGITCSTGERDFIVGKPWIENVRSAIKNCKIVVAFVTKAYNKKEGAYYEPALALDLHKDVIIVNTGEVKIHPLFKSCTVIKAYHRPLNVWSSELLKTTMRLINKNDTKLLPLQWSLLKEFIWSVEEQIQGTVEASLSETARLYETEIQNLKKDKHALMKVRMREISELQKENERLQAEITSLQSKKDKIEKERGILLSEVQRYQISREQACGQGDKIARRQIEYCLELRKIKVRLDDVVSLLRSNNTDKILQELTTSIGNLTDTQSHTCNSIEMLSMAIYGIKSGFYNDKNGQGTVNIPTEIKTFCNKYQNMVGHNVLKLARQLGLSEEQMMKVEQRREYGHCEMFWLVIREWVSSTTDDNKTFTILLDGLQKAGISIEGHPMPPQHLNTLHKNIVYLQENLMCITIILSDLLEQGVVDLVGISYILSSDTRHNQVLRLVDALSITDRGFSLFCRALNNSGQEFISDHLNDYLKNESSTSPRQPHEHDENKGPFDSQASKKVFGCDTCEIDTVPEVPVAKVAPTARITNTTNEIIIPDPQKKDRTQRKGAFRRLLSFLDISSR